MRAALADYEARSAFDDANADENAALPPIRLRRFKGVVTIPVGPARE
jgi:hypothetical protein